MSKYSNLTPDELFRVAEIEADTDLEKALIESMTNIVSEAIDKSNEDFEGHYNSRESEIINKINSAMGLDANDYDTDVFTQVRHLRSRHDELETDLQKTSAALLVAQERAAKAEDRVKELERCKQINLTYAEVSDLAGFCDLTISHDKEWNADTEIGLRENVVLDNEDGTATTWPLAMYFIDCPEEGFIGIGDHPGDHKISVDEVKS